MSKKLAIRGHSTRGKEVIELLEMMGGKNCYNLNGLFTDYEYYFIGGPHNVEIRGGEYIFDEYAVRQMIDDMCFFTLEEFLEKYPFKVGDKVVYTKFGDNCDDYPTIIKSMKWTGTTIEYTFDDYATCLAKDLKMWNGKPDAVISNIFLNRCVYADEVELNLGDYEIEVRDGRTYAVKKKPKYPTNYNECCEVLDFCGDYFLTTYGEDCSINKRGIYEIFRQVDSLTRLLICKSAYWKIAGEELGLGKPWEPKCDYDEEIFFIYCDRANGINKGQGFPSDNFCLTFPTAEMRDEFYENFKDVIELCKELL